MPSQGVPSEGALPAASPPSAPPPAKERILAVDALRGFDMFWILGAAGLVQALSKLGDTPFLRATYEQLDHKDWEGFAFLDLIFPLFVFLAGMSVVFSLGRIAGGDVRAALGVYGDIVLYLVGVTLMLGLARFLYTRKVFVRA